MTYEELKNQKYFDVNLAQELALTPLNDRGKAINHDWIKKAKRTLQGILGRG